MAAETAAVILRAVQEGLTNVLRHARASRVDFALVREGAWGSWFSRVGFHGIADGVLTLRGISATAGARAAIEAAGGRFAE